MTIDPRLQRIVAAQPYPLLFATISGAHLYGFPSADSDYDSQWKLFEKERPRRVKPLLYVYRVLLTGIHLMRSGRIEANLLRLNEEFALPFLGDLIQRKLSGPEKAIIEDTDMTFHEAEYQRLRGVLQAAHEGSRLRELPDDATRAALDDLLVRMRTRGLKG